MWHDNLHVVQGADVVRRWHVLGVVGRWHVIGASNMAQQLPCGAGCWHHARLARAKRGVACAWHNNLRVVQGVGVPGEVPRAWHVACVMHHSWFSLIFRFFFWYFGFIWLSKHRVSCVTTRTINLMVWRACATNTNKGIVWCYLTFYMDTCYLSLYSLLLFYCRFLNLMLKILCIKLLSLKTIPWNYKTVTIPSPKIIKL